MIFIKMFEHDILFLNLNTFINRINWKTTIDVEIFILCCENSKKLNYRDLLFLHLIMLYTDSIWHTIFDKNNIILLTVYMVYR